LAHAAIEFAIAVFFVADDGVPLRLAMHPDLMRSAGDQLYLDYAVVLAAA
jgi:hypothetical protein